MYDASLTPRDLFGKFDALRVECAKCDRYGHYRFEHLVVHLGLDAKLTDWLSRLAADCPRRGDRSEGCAACFPDLLKPAQ